MINRLNKNIGAQLQFKRQEKGIKQDVLAKKLKVSTSYVRKIENGRIPSSLLFFFQYCNAIEISPDDVVNTITIFLKQAVF